MPRKAGGANRRERSNPQCGQKTEAAQIALAWLLAKKPWIVPIPARPSYIGSKKTWEPRISSCRPKIREIENAASNIWAEEARYPENLQKMVGR
jgi:hypothetical protein